ncbi:unnamed protein product, partial [Ectocarpus sp. 13 AM-2016]
GPRSSTSFPTSTAAPASSPAAAAEAAEAAEAPLLPVRERPARTCSAASKLPDCRKTPPSLPSSLPRRPLLPLPLPLPRGYLLLLLLLPRQQAAPRLGAAVPPGEAGVQCSRSRTPAWWPLPQPRPCPPASLAAEAFSRSGGGEAHSGCSSTRFKRRSRRRGAPCLE